MNQATNNSGYIVKSVSSLSELDAVVSIQTEIWGYGRKDSDHPYPARALFALVQSGGLVSCAYSSNQAVGFALAWLGRNRESESLYLHSQLLGVIPQHRGKGLGLRLKMHQKDFARDAGLSLIRWTFDPLQVANARLNLHRLGGVANDYVVDLYGNLKSNLSSGVESDRLWLNWYLDSHRVEQRVDPLAKNTQFHAIPCINQCSTVDLRGFRFLEIQKLNLTAEDRHLLMEVPTDFDLMRQSGLDLARSWRMQVRKALCHYFTQGYILDDFIVRGCGAELRGFYKLNRDPLETILTSG